MEKDIILQLNNVSVQFGGVQALASVSLALDDGEMVALMGPNGAGKSTVLKAIFGLLGVQSGEVLYHGQRVNPLPHEMVARGVAFVPQGRRVFAGLTVKENLEVGASLAIPESEMSRRTKEVLDLFPVLGRKWRQRSGELSGGEQQMLALARGLMVDPKVLLLDEPTLGLAPKIVSEVFAKILEINDRHRTAIMIVEHNIQSILKVVGRGYVIDKGRLVFSGTSKEILERDILREIFLGG